MPNFQLLTAVDEEQTQSSSWRSFGSVAASLLARAEERRTETPSDDDGYAPVAWAAE